MSPHWVNGPKPHENQSIAFTNEEKTLSLYFSPETLSTFNRHRQSHSQDTERGGQLFAPSIGSSDGCVRISIATPPHRNDRATRFSLELDPRRCRSEIRTHYRDGLHLVGYWHTHPQTCPSISTKDIASLSQNLTGGGWSLTRLVAIVVGTKQIAAYTIDAQRSARRLSLISIAKGSQ